MWSREKRGFDLLIARSNEYHNVLKILKKIVHHLLRRKIFLDVGAGNPETLTSSIGKFFEKTCVIEPNPKYQKLHKQKGYSIISSILETANLKPETFDFILCAHVLYYVAVDRWREVIEKMYTSLTRGGILVLVLHSEKSRTHELMEIMYGRKLSVSAGKLEEIISKLYSKTQVYSYPGKILLQSPAEYNMLIEFLGKSLPKNKSHATRKIQEFNKELQIDNSGWIITIQKD